MEGSKMPRATNKQLEHCKGISMQGVIVTLSEKGELARRRVSKLRKIQRRIQKFSDLGVQTGDTR